MKQGRDRIARRAGAVLQLRSGSCSLPCLSSLSLPLVLLNKKKSAVARRESSRLSVEDRSEHLCRPHQAFFLFPSLPLFPFCCFVDQSMNELTWNVLVCVCACVCVSFSPCKSCYAGFSVGVCLESQACVTRFTGDN